MLLALPAWVWSRRSLWPLTLSALVVLGPIMAFHAAGLMPISHARGPILRVINCNVDGENLNAEALFKLIEAEQADVVACQEWQGHEELIQALQQLGWHMRTDRGLFLASKLPILSARTIASAEDWRDLAAIYSLQSPWGTVQFVNLHLETARKGLEPLMEGRQAETHSIVENIRRRGDESELVRGRAELLGPPLLIAGDFNLPADSAIYRSNWSRFADSFESAGFGYGYTKWTHYWGIRIDHLLTGAGFRVRSCRVGPDVGSDHDPLITEVEWVGG